MKKKEKDFYTVENFALICRKLAQNKRGELKDFITAVCYFDLKIKYNRLIDR